MDDWYLVAVAMFFFKTKCRKQEGCSYFCLKGQYLGILTSRGSNNLWMRNKNLQTQELGFVIFKFLVDVHACVFGVIVFGRHVAVNKDLNVLMCTMMTTFLGSFVRHLLFSCIGWSFSSIQWFFGFRSKICFLIIIVLRKISLISMYWPSVTTTYLSSNIYAILP